VLLPVGPDKFHRVQFRCVGRQILLVNPAFETGDRLEEEFIWSAKERKNLPKKYNVGLEPATSS
jgi:hypothetical protein